MVLVAQQKPLLALAEARLERNEPEKLAALALIYSALERPTESISALKALESQFGRSSPETIAGVYAMQGNSNGAFEWLDRALEERDPGIFAIKGDPSLDSLRGDPRYKVLLRKMKLPE